MARYVTSPVFHVLLHTLVIILMLIPVKTNKIILKRFALLLPVYSSFYQSCPLQTSTVSNSDIVAGGRYCIIIL